VRSAEILGRTRWKREGFTPTISWDIRLFLGLAIDPYLPRSWGAAPPRGLPQKQLTPSGTSPSPAASLVSLLTKASSTCFASSVSGLSNHPPPSVPGEARLAAQQQLQARAPAPMTTQGIYSQRWNIKITSLIAS